LYRLKTTSQQIGMVLSARASGLDLSALFTHHLYTTFEMTSHFAPTVKRPAFSPLRTHAVKESFPFSAVFYIALYPSSKLLVIIMMGDILMQIGQAEN